MDRPVDEYKRDNYEPRVCEETFKENHPRQVLTNVYNFSNISINVPFPKSYKTKKPIIIKNIGSGSFSKVYKAKLGDTFVAMKVIQIQTAKDIPRIETETKILNTLKHKNIILLIGSQIVQEKDQHVMFFEYSENFKTIDRFILDSFKSNYMKNVKWKYPGPFDITSFKKIIFQTIDAIHYAHENLISHRDIKPGNIIYNGQDIKIIDWGLSIFLKSKKDVIKIVSGSPLYFSPEMVEQNPNFNPMIADMWQIGITIYEIAFGNTPFDPLYYEDLVEKIQNQDIVYPTGTTEDFYCFISKILEKNAEKRATPLELLKEEFVLF
jgi:serine/threonine protein kinase